MDYNKVQTNQTAQSQPQASTAPRYNSPRNDDNGPSAGKRLAVLVAILVVVVALIVGGLYVATRSSQKNDASSTAVETAGYQAVFMTNGQVYFGHLSNLGASYAQLTDVYYLQVQQPVQPADNKTTAATGDKSQVSLTKLGNELHGPKDRMHISSDQILFWENLKDDSTVVKAIKEYKTKQQ